MIKVSNFIIKKLGNDNMQSNLKLVEELFKCYLPNRRFFSENFKNIPKVDRKKAIYACIKIKEI